MTTTNHCESCQHYAFHHHARRHRRNLISVSSIVIIINNIITGIVTRSSTAALLLSLVSPWPSTTTATPHCDDPKTCRGSPGSRSEGRAPAKILPVESASQNPQAHVFANHARPKPEALRKLPLGLRSLAPDDHHVRRRDGYCSFRAACSCSFL